MRICFISHSSRNGGAERVLLESIEILQMHGMECKVLLPHHGDLCAELDRIGTPFSVVSFPLWMAREEISLFSFFKAAFSTLVSTIVVAWKIYCWKCDQIYSNTVTVCVGAFAALLLGRPHIWHLHEFGKEDQGLSFLFGKRFSLGIVNRLSSRCICVSRVLAKHYEQSVESSKITVIYPSMHLAPKDAASDSSDFAILPANGRFRCVIVGALTEGKGQEESVMALADLKKRGLDAELLIVGEGVRSYRCRLEELVAANALETQVAFAGQVKSALPAMRSANAVLVCSKSEAFGRVTIEGMLAGKPVIGARRGATAELIKEGVNGLLYNYGDPKDLADKIQYLYKNPAVAEQLGKAAQSWVEGFFTAERYSKEILALLNSPLGVDVAGAGSIPAA
jgi:glycosyltransferase involved in cell wall biosynthesis